MHVAGVRRVRREHRGWVEHAQDHAVLGRHVVDGGQHVAAAHGQAMIEPGRLDPGAPAGERACGMHIRQQQLEPELPLTAPDLRSHLDGVVVGDHDAAQPVAQRERAQAAVLLVVPHDAQALRPVLDAELARQVAAAERRVAARRVACAALADLHVVCGHSLRERNVAVGAGEEAVEAERQVLAHQHLAVARDGDVDARLRDREALVRERRGGRGERRDESQDEPRAAPHRRPSAKSKSARRRNPSAPAIKLAGSCSMEALYVCTVSL